MTDLIDFERLRARDNIKLFVAATQVRAGNLRLFETEELSADALLASGVLPPSLVNTGHRRLAALLRQRGIISIAFGATAIVSRRIIGVEICALAKPLWQIRIGQEQTTEDH